MHAHALTQSTQALLAARQQAEQTAKALAGFLAPLDAVLHSADWRADWMRTPASVSAGAAKGGNALWQQQHDAHDGASPQTGRTRPAR
jgi:hypothetical protein